MPSYCFNWSSTLIFLYFTYLLGSLVILYNGLFALFPVHPLAYVPNFAKNLLLFGKFAKAKSLLNKTNGSTKDPTAAPSRNSESVNQGICIKLTSLCHVPKAWFKHFYIFAFAVWFIVVAFAATWPNVHWNDLNLNLLLISQLIQSCRRIYETCYVSIYSG